MGAVWLAQNSAIEAEVAIKVLHSALVSETGAVARFRQEARAAARIGHPNIVRVMDFGDVEGGPPYIVMERLKGESLAHRIEQARALAAREIVPIVIPVLAALEAAHTQGILHRD